MGKKIKNRINGGKIILQGSYLRNVIRLIIPKA